MTPGEWVPKASRQPPYSAPAQWRCHCDAQQQTQKGKVCNLKEELQSLGPGVRVLRGTGWSAETAA